MLSLFFVLDGPKHHWALVDLVPLATGLIGWCPAYVEGSHRQHHHLAIARGEAVHAH